MDRISDKPIVYFDAELRPNRSLSKRAFYIVMGVTMAFVLSTGFVFFSLGAIPIVGFLGLDLLAIYLAFRFCFRQQSQHTRVTVTADHLRVDHVNPKGQESSVELPTAFARVELAEPLNARSWLTLASTGEAYGIGRFLTVAERKSLAHALRNAISDARRERYLSKV